MVKKQSINLSDNEISIINQVMAESGLSFSGAVRLIINKSSFASNVDLLEKIPTDNKSQGKQGYYIRLPKKEDDKIRIFADSKGITVPQEIRFRISSTLGESLFNINEALALTEPMHNINKVGRLVNQAIKDRRILSNEITAELLTEIKSLSSAMKEIIVKTYERVK